MSLVPFLAITVFLVLLMNPEVTSGCYIKTNGCSVPLDLPFIYKKTLTPACVKHDVCYSCGEKYVWNQKQCDDAFKRDMYKLCEKRARKRWFFPSLVESLTNKVKRCKTFGADVYYRAVDTFGHLHWEKNPPSWCNQECAKNLGHPGKSLNV